MLLGHSRTLSGVASSLSLLFACFACDSRDTAPTPVPARSAHVHPDFPTRPSPEMIANSELVAQLQRRADEAAAAASAAAKLVPPKKWNDSCLIHRECTKKEQAIPSCEETATARYWAELQGSADSLIGQSLDIKGTLGLAIAAAPNSATKCAPDTCCHALRMDLRIEGEPISLPLAGLSCAGDDSKLCCPVPANNQMVIAHGRLTKAKASSSGKWQLEDVKLCEVQAPAPPDH